MTEINHELDETIRKLVAYMKTEEGQEKMRKLRATLDEYEKNLRKQEEVDPLKLFERITI